MTQVQYRNAQPCDLEIIHRFQMAMAQETENLELNPAVLRTGIQAVFDDPQKGRYLIAEQSGKVLGCLLLQAEWSDWRNGQVLWIHSLYVVPGARKLGVFSGLYNHIRSEVLADPNLKGIRLYVDQRNDRAQKAYLKMGMTAEHYALFEWLK